MVENVQRSTMNKNRETKSTKNTKHRRGEHKQHHTEATDTERVHTQMDKHARCPLASVIL